MTDHRKRNDGQHLKKMLKNMRSNKDFNFIKIVTVKAKINE